MQRVILSAFACCIVAVCVFGQASREPSFKSYPATVEKRQAKSINFKDPAARTMRTRLSEALAGGVNFAGHYIVAGWGCGTGCISGAVIDARDGKVYWPLPLYALASGTNADGNYVDEPVAYSKNSRLLVITGSPGVKDNQKEKPSGKYFYEWRGNDLKLIKFIPIKSE